MTISVEKSLEVNLFYNEPLLTRATREGGLQGHCRSLGSEVVKTLAVYGNLRKFKHFKRSYKQDSKTLANF